MTYSLYHKLCTKLIHFCIKNEFVLSVNSCYKNFSLIYVISWQAVHQIGHQSRNLRVVCAGAEGSGSCCGGSSSESSSSGGGSCSSHGKKAPPPGVAGVGAEFENMVSRSTMQEFEKEYETGQVRFWTILFTPDPFVFVVV